MNMNLKTSLIVIVQFIGILALILVGIGLAIWLVYVDEKLARCIGGIALIIFGFIVFKYGDANVENKGGIILKIFTMPRLNRIVLKWAIVLISIFFGIILLFNIH